MTDPETGHPIFVINHPLFWLFFVFCFGTATPSIFGNTIPYLFPILLVFFIFA
jgi:hypothetical protein